MNILDLHYSPVLEALAKEANSRINQSKNYRINESTILQLTN